jgi:hypothetical protein
MAISHMSHIVKINVFMICIFIIFKRVYFTTVILDLHFKYKCILSQLNDLVYISCGKQMKLSISYRISFSPAFFLLGSSNLF